MFNTSLKTIFALSLLSLIACSGQQSALNTNELSPDAIVGGQVVVPKSEISKSIVGIYDAGEGAICTGSLLPGNIVLTAAHCIGGDPTKMYIIFDVDMISTLQSKDQAVILKVVRPVTSAMVNPGWTEGKNQTQEMDWDDIALIKFAGKVPTGFRPVKMLSDAAALTTGGSVVLAGYGVDKIEIADIDAATTPNLDEEIAKQEIFCSADRKQCKKVHSEGAGLLRTTDVTVSKVDAHEVVLDQTAGHGACSGDSGGPAYVLKNGKYYLWGITSRGTVGCAEDIIYTNALGYGDWIAATIPTLK